MPYQRSGNIQDFHPFEKVFNTLLFIMVLFSSIFTMRANAAVPGWQQTMVDSCNSGVMQECLNVGVAFKTGQFKGKKAAKDPKKAEIFIKDGLRLAKKSCDQGNAQDCYTIGLMYFEGGVIPTDVPRGLNYLQRSCKSGYKEACNWLDNSGLQQMIR